MQISRLDWVRSTHRGLGFQPVGPADDRSTAAWQLLKSRAAQWQARRHLKLVHEDEATSAAHCRRFFDLRHFFAARGPYDEDP